jgi:alkylation response protein AidB-like acyl-CoA dehydrogenase
LTVVDDINKRELRDTVRRFFDTYSDESAVRSTMDSAEGFDRALWRRMADEVGFQATLVPERLGGAELGFSNMQIVVEEMGRALVCSPFLSSAVMCATALLAAEETDILAGIADGSTIAALAFLDRRGQWNSSEDHAHAELTADGGWVLTGTYQFVLDAAVADVVLVAAATSAGPGLFAVRTDTAGVRRTPLETLDMTRRQADLAVDSAPAIPVGRVGDADAYLAAAFNAGLAALAAEQVGGARRLLEMSVEYASVREQFGRPIGSFQAIKHKCADMLVEVESATSAAYAAGTAIDEGSDESAVLASLAKAYCSEAYCHVAAENIQIHGGIGFTWEHPAHLYYRRARSTEMLFGTPTYHRERMLKELGL